MDHRHRLPGAALTGRAVVFFAAAACQCLFAQLPAQPPAPKPATTSAAAHAGDPLGRDSPQSCVVSFLEAAHASDYSRAWRYLDLRKLPQKQRLSDGPQLAQQLAQILDNDPQFDVASLSRQPEGDLDDSHPKNHEPIDTFTVNGNSVALQLERVTLHNGNSVWLFSGDSVTAIPQLARQTSDSPIERYLPLPLVNWRWLDTPIWRWIALTLLAIGITIFSGVLSRGTLRLGRPVLKRVAPRANWSALEMFAGPTRTLLGVAMFRAAMVWTEPSALPRLYLERALGLLFSLGVAWLLAQLVEFTMRHLRAALGDKFQTLSYSVLPLLSRVLKITILLLAIIVTLDNWGYNTRTILATLGIGGLAIALAAQKTVEHLFGGVAVISDRPVVVGDYCKFGDQKGTVEDIGLRSTRIRTDDRTLVTVPNGPFSSMTLENFSRRDKMLLHFTLNLRRDTTPEQVRAVLSSISALLKGNNKFETGAMPVRFIGVGTYSLDLEVSLYVLTRNGDEFLQIQQDLFLGILDAIEAAGTALALPTQASIPFAPAARQPEPKASEIGASYEPIQRKAR